MSYPFYNWLHIVGIIMVFSALGAQAFYVAGGGQKTTWNLRRMTAITHGLGMLLLLVAGFGMMAKLNYSFSTDIWLYHKLIVWLLLGGAPAILWRRGPAAKWLLLGTIALGAFAAFVGIFKI